MAEKFFGGRKLPLTRRNSMYGIIEREDGWIEVRVYHTNQEMRKALRAHQDNPGYFLVRCGDYAENNLSAKKWLAEVMTCYQSHFEQGYVEIILC